MHRTHGREFKIGKVLFCCVFRPVFYDFSEELDIFFETFAREKRKLNISRTDVETM